MTLWSDLFNSRHLLSRTFYGTPGTQTITAPARAAFIRVSMVGAGGWDSFIDISPTPGPGGNMGHGAAFARVKATCAPTEQFSVQVGDIAHTRVAGDALGDSICTRVTGSVVICKAVRGTSSAPGNATNSVGDTKRTGGSPPGGNTLAGSSAGDDADTFPLGFGGRGASQFLAAAPGGGGNGALKVYSDAGSTYQLFLPLPPGNGRVCVEFFDQDPTIAWPGYAG